MDKLKEIFYDNFSQKKQSAPKTNLIHIYARSEEK